MFDHFLHDFEKLLGTDYLKHFPVITVKKVFCLKYVKWDIRLSIFQKDFFDLFLKNIIINSKQYKFLMI